MKKSRLTIQEEQNKITIKKKADVGNCFLFTLVFACGVLLPILFESVREINFFWGVWAVCMLSNIAMFLSVFFGKIVVDSEKREINIYNFCRETYRFDDIREFKYFCDDSDPEGPDRYKVLFIFTNGRKSEIETASKEQTEELIELLNGMIFAKK